ncbi:MAG: RES family NAD+ phosphorylase [Azospirillaceae bacterium]
MISSEIVSNTYYRISLNRYAGTPLGFREEAASRFSDPRIDAGGVGLGTYAMVYAASDHTTAFAETVLGNDHEFRSGPLTLDETADIRAHVVFEIVAEDPLLLVDMTDLGALRLGMPTDALRASAHGPARAWALAIHDHPARPDGIAYPSRLTNRPTIAVFDRALEKLDAVATTPLADHSDLSGVLDALEFVLAP